MRIGSLICKVKHAGMFGVFMLLIWGGFAQENVEWQDLSTPHVNREAARSSFFAYENHLLALEGDPDLSQNYLSLNGSWKFLWLDDHRYRPAHFYRTSYNDQAWSTIEVPASWEMNEHGWPRYLNQRYAFAPEDPRPPQLPTEGHPVGQYRKTFELPSHWKEQAVFLEMAAASGAYYVWVNGYKVGYHQDSHLPARFELSNYLEEGNNLIAIELYKWSDGSYLECHDAWQLSGILQDVSLHARPRLHVQDMTITPRLDSMSEAGWVDITVELHNLAAQAAEQHWLEFEIVDPDGWNVIESATNRMVRLEGRSRLTLQSRLELPRVRPWNAEQPFLYTLTLSLRNEKGDVMEVIPQKIGFREVSIRNGKLLINGTPITLKGVNYRPFDPARGYVASEALIRQDLLAMKQHNFNAIRTQGRPLPPLFYALCDAYGFYVIDEANISSAAIPAAPHLTLGNRPEWYPNHLSRWQGMLERDKNHPSIIAWSMGRAAGNGVNLYRMYQWARERSRSLPIVYEQAGREWNSDLFFPDQPSLEDLVTYHEGTPDAKPMVAANLGYNWGNGLGGFSTYWTQAQKLSGFQGGFLGAWKDEAISSTATTQGVGWVYGGDLGPEALPNDSSDCLKGLVAPDGQALPALQEVKQVFSPLEVHAIDLKGGKFKLQNRYDFRSLEHLALQWHVLRNGVAVDQGTFLNLSAAAQHAQLISLPYLLPDSGQEHEYILHLSFQQRAGEAFARPGQEVAWAQFVLNERQASEHERVSTLPELTLDKYKREWRIESADFSVIFDRDLGRITSYTYRKENLLLEGLQPLFWRPSVAQTRGHSPDPGAEVWEHAHERAIVRRACYEKIHDGLIRIGVEHVIPPQNISYKVVYAFFGSGDILVDVRLDLQEVQEPLPQAPRVGMHLVVPARLGLGRWYGRGPQENYANRKSGAPLGIHSRNLYHQPMPYLYPQAYGHLSDLRWLSLTEGSGKGLLISGMPTFELTAIPHQLRELEGGFRHRWELARASGLHVIIDGHHAPLPSFAPTPADAAPKHQEELRFQFRLTPLEVESEPTELSRQEFEETWMPGTRMDK